MVTIGEIVERVQSLYSSGAPSDDSRLSNRLIYQVMLSVRAMLLSQEANKRQKLHDWNYSILNCIEVIKVEKHDCPCLPPLGCKVYRTKYPLPKPLHSLNRHLISWVLSVEDSQKFDESNRVEMRSVSGNKYTSKVRRYIEEQGHLYFFTPSMGKAVKLKMLAEDPLEVKDYQGLCGCKDCDDCTSYLEYEFPFDRDKLDTLVKMCAEELIKIFSTLPEDQTNNSKDNPIERTK